MVGSRVYVGGLPYGTTERDLERFFRGYGRMRDVLIKNGYGFVEFDDHRDADDAVYELNGKKLLGERVTVERARGTPRAAAAGPAADLPNVLGRAAVPDAAPAPRANPGLGQGPIPALPIISAPNPGRSPKKGPGHVPPAKAGASPGVGLGQPTNLLHPNKNNLDLNFYIKYNNTKKDRLKPTETYVTSLDGKVYKQTKDSFEFVKNQAGYVVDTKPDKVPAKIIDCLYLGSQDCCEKEVLEEYNIKFVLSIGVEAPTRYEGITYLFVDCLDLPETDLEKSLRECVPFIKNA
ncbi:unnamed protein product, partial [Callosobruchus maculatus]